MKKIITGIVAVLILSVLSYLAYDEYHDWQEEKLYRQKIQTILAQINIPENASFHDQIDRVRYYVFDTTDHNMNEEFYAIWRDQNRVAQEVINFSKGDRQTQVPLECSTRTGLMDAMIRALGYRTRVINVYEVKKDLPGHVFVEILNPDTGKWEAYDPDYDISWRNKTGARVSFAQAWEDPENHHPCGRNGVCGWDYKSDENRNLHRIKKYKLISIIDRDAGQRYTLYPDGIDPKAVYNYKGKTATFCDHIDKNCRQGFYPLSERPDHDQTSSS